MDKLTAFGLFAVTAMLVCYALEKRSAWFILAFAGPVYWNPCMDSCRGPGRSASWNHENTADHKKRWSAPRDVFDGATPTSGNLKQTGVGRQRASAEIG